jgi:hypothetical protein
MNMRCEQSKKQFTEWMRCLDDVKNICKGCKQQTEKDLIGWCAKYRIGPQSNPCPCYEEELKEESKMGKKVEPIAPDDARLSKAITDIIIDAFNQKIIANFNGRTAMFALIDSNDFCHGRQAKLLVDLFSRKGWKVCCKSSQKPDNREWTFSIDPIAED